jgi:hypothetical protein
MTAAEEAADQAKADRIAAGIEGQAPGEAGPGEQPAEDDAAWNARAVETWRNDYGEPADALVAEWGGIEGGDFRENMKFARYAALKAKADHPEVFDILSAPLELESGRTIALGDHPGMIRLASQYGRLLAHLNFEDPDPAPRNSQQQTRTQTMPQSNEAAEEEMERLTTELHQAVSSGLNVKARKIEKKRSALAKKLYGEKPYLGPLGDY